MPSIDDRIASPLADTVDATIHLGHVEANMIGGDLIYPTPYPTEEAAATAIGPDRPPMRLDSHPAAWS